MKTIVVKLLIVAGALAGISSAAAQTKDSATPPATAKAVPAAISGPKIQFAETVFDFGKISSGEVAKHEFVFTNTGSATLEINDVRPGCGCTTAGTWDKKVEPGKSGVIPLQFNSTGFSGTVTKSATVTCNDPGQSNLVLQLKANIWKAIDVTPTMAVFTMSSEAQTNETRSVRIVSNLEEPLELSDLQCTNSSFRAELKTVRQGKEFELLITAVPPFLENRIVTAVSLKTSSPTNPTINVSAYLNVQPTVTVMPNHVMLPQGPLTNVAHSVVTIQNAGTNSLVLTEPAVNVPGAEAHVQETQPGRLFTLTVDFPLGFQAKVGQKVEVTVKSNHPKFPLIQVPVYQPQPPATPPSVEKASSPTQVVPAKTASSVPGGN
jgi:hypothetical protein